MKVLLLGQNSYPANFYLKTPKEKIINIVTIKERFDHYDIINLDDDLFYEKYFRVIGANFDCSLNYAYIHNSSIASEFKINSMLCKKLIYVFKKIKVKKNIYISTVNSYKETKSEYGKAKYICEEIYRSLDSFLIIRPSTIIDIDYKKRLINGGKNGKSFESLNRIISKFPFFPVPGFGNYLQTVCFADDFGRFINCVINNNLFINKTINFFTGEMISYNNFLDVNFNFRNIKRVKIFIPKFLILNIIRFVKLIFKNLTISSKNIDNLTNQKIEFDFSKQVEELIKLNKFKNLN